VRALFQRALNEMDAGWYGDHLGPTPQHMASATQNAVGAAT